MTKKEKEYLLKLANADLKNHERVLPMHQEYLAKEGSNKEWWTKTISATKNKIALAQKTIESLNKL